MGLFGFGGPSEHDILMDASLAFSKDLGKEKDCKKAFKRLRSAIEQSMKLHCPDILSSGWTSKGQELFNSLSTDLSDKKNKIEIYSYLMRSIYYIKQNKYEGRPDKVLLINNMIYEYFDCYFK